LEAETAIRQLAIRYAHAVDSRNIDALVALFVSDTDMSTGKGPAGVRARYARALHSAYRTIHTVSNHLIDLVDEEHATGRVYTRAEEERKDSWAVRAMMYFDEYRLENGRWGFVDRKTHYWYLTEFDRRPHAPGFMDPADHRGRLADLPNLHRSWKEFWAEAGPEATSAVTNEP
jgi:hypothetical protein